ncbi:hypothetical protein [Thermomonas sp.]|uniref:hypothetical protein n=1 Tax=Thermomonas sp. TaxID=1971895 RepID=UPI002487192F|nr:hypothetical protein [Thermomonas sp.]MDI1252332.1 hypothetical protein [Thermomonas sp.]
MTTRAVGPGRGWGWLQQAINLGRNNPKAIFGATALMAVVALIPSVLQIVLQYVFKESPSAIVAVMAITTVVSMVVTALLIGGLLRVIHAAENGQPTHATAIFDTFRESQVRGRLIGFGVLMMVIYLGVFVAVISLFGKDFMRWYWELITSAQAMQAAGGTAPPPNLAEMPEGLGRIMSVGSLFAMFMGGVYAVGFGQVALGGRRVGEAFVDGLRGAIKNVLPIIVLAVLSVLGMLVLTLGVVLVAGIITLIAGMISKVLALVLLVPIYFGMILLIYVVMFGVMYFMWRDICTDAPPPLARADQLEL